MTYKLALVDMDLITYRCGFAVERFSKEEDTVYVEPWSNCVFNIRNMVKRILGALDPEQYNGYLTSNDRSNFRFSIFPEYKQQRKKVAKPHYYHEIRDFLVSEYSAIMVSGEEADDRISIDHCKAAGNIWTEDNKSSIIVSIDKDFNNVPGWHYNFVKEYEYYVDEIQSLRNFYLQILTGDMADGIPRIKKGWRQKTVETALKDATTETEMINLVSEELYNIQEGDSKDSDAMRELFTKRGKLVWLRRKEGELWTIPSNLS